MKNSYWIFFVVVLAGFLLLTIRQNGELKEQRDELQQTNASMEEQVEANGDHIHTDAGDVAESFLFAYFQYEENPTKEDVQSYVTEDMMNKLSFTSTDGEYETTASDVADMDMYFGDYTKTRQRIFITFTNELTFNEVTSEAPSYLQLDMKQTSDDKWVISNMDYQQY